MPIDWTKYHNRQYRKYMERVKQFKTLAKRASDRMRSIQKLAESGDKRFENAMQFAYRRALYDIQSFWGPKAQRWEHKQKTKFNSYQELLDASTELRKQTRAIERFLSMETSTKTGIKESFMKRVDTFNEKMGTNFTWEQMASFWESKAYDKLMRRFQDSKTAFVALYKKKAEITGEELTKEARKNSRVQKKVDKQIEEFLQEEGLSIKDLFKV